MMADYDRDIEDLKVLVTKALEKKGVLSKIRAQLRASVFQAIEEQDRVSGANGGEMALVGGCSPEAKEMHATPNGRLLCGLVLEYLEWAQLKHTAQIYLPEADLSDMQPDRIQLADSLGLSHATRSTDKPLLMELLESKSSNKPFEDTSPSSHGPSTSGVPLQTKESAADKPWSHSTRYPTPPATEKVSTAAAFYTSPVSAAPNGTSIAAGSSDSQREPEPRSLLGALPPLQKPSLPSLSDRRFQDLGASQDETGFGGLGPSGEGRPAVASARTRRTSSGSEESPNGERADEPGTPSEERDIEEEIEEDDLSIEASDLSVGSQSHAASFQRDDQLAHKRLGQLDLSK